MTRGEAAIALPIIAANLKDAGCSILDAKREDPIKYPASQRRHILLRSTSRMTLLSDLYATAY
jgi:hypothetical protein